MKRNRRYSLKPAARAAHASPRIDRARGEGELPVAPRIAIAGVIGALVFGVLMLRLWALTVLGGAEYAERADRNQLRLLPVEAPRGQILDRSKRPIVTNRPARQVVLDLQLAGDEDEIDATLRALSGPLGVPIDEMRKRVKNAAPGALEPIVLVNDVPTRDDAKIWWLSEHEADFPGIRVENRSMRKYTQGSLGAHFLGSVGAVSPNELKGSHTNLEPTDRVGKSGLERKYDQYLRGANGYQSIQVDATGQRQNGDARGLPATPGRDLQTTISLKVQKDLEKSLRNRLAKARGTADGRSASGAAAVVMDVKTGGVLAMASNPTFDPSIFVNASDPENAAALKWLYSEKNTAKPSINRAIQGEYAPASTYKVITSVAALEERYLRLGETLPCPASSEIKGTVFKNHETDNRGAISLQQALATSCDTFYYKLAMHFYEDDAAPLQAWSRKFGLGSPTGLDIGGESAGLVPTVAWRKEHYTRPEDKIWKPGFSVNMSIGQGDLTTTVLQMTNVFATIANGGVKHTPHLGQAVLAPDGSQAYQLPVDKPVDLKINPTYLADIMEGLEQVANGPNGTAQAVFENFAIRTAGKSGTGERLKPDGTPLPDLSWYCGYAPAEKPEIAVCGFIDGGGGGSSAAGPIVLDVFNSYFAKRIKAMNGGEEPTTPTTDTNGDGIVDEADATAADPDTEATDPNAEAAP